MLTLFTEIDELDGEKSDYVTTNQFVESILEITSGHLVRRIDCEFLALKYSNMRGDGFGRVRYRFFYNDYNQLEEEGLGEKLYGLRTEDFAKKKEEMASNSMIVRIPQKFIDFYEKIEMWVVKNRKTAQLCNLLVREDKAREGYLTARQLHKCFETIGMALKPKQIGQMSHPLHQDAYGRFSYPELIDHVFGR